MDAVTAAGAVRLSDRDEAGGSWKQRPEPKRRWCVSIPVMLIIILTVLMIQLQRLSAPYFLVIRSLASLGLIGVCAIMLPTGTPIKYIANLGMIALIGIIIRNSGDPDRPDRGRDPRPDNTPAMPCSMRPMHRVRPNLLTAVTAMRHVLPSLSMYLGTDGPLP